MCQNNNNLNTNVYPFGIVDRDQNIMSTYSRMIKTRRSSNTSSSDSTSSAPSHQNCSQANCDYFMNPDKSERSDLCDKKMSTMNMDQSSCFATNLLERFQHSDESSRIFSNGQNVYVETNQYVNMDNGCKSQKASATHRHRTIRSGSTKASDCLVLFVVCFVTLAINQTFAKPVTMEGIAESLRSPCSDVPHPELEHNLENIKDILTVISRQSGIAKSAAGQDVAEYLKITEGSNVDEFHNTWRAMEQLWLYPHGKKIQKGFHEQVPADVQEHYRQPASRFNDENMKKVFIQRLINLLQESDERFQLLLIGFHNILDDHNSKRSTMEFEAYEPLSKIFKSAKSNAKKVLCEIRTALHKLGANVNILDPQKIHSSKADNANFYDWVVFREYINQLEHINEISDIILSKLN